jgi:hypothetical protein
LTLNLAAGQAIGPVLLGSFAFCNVASMNFALPEQRKHADNVSAVAGPRFSG